MSDPIRFRFSLPAAVWLTYFLLRDPSGGAVYSICAAAFHECGHLLLLFLLHGRPKAIAFGVYGVRIEPRDGVTLSYGRDFAVAAAGPVCNLLLGGVLWMLHMPTAARINGALAAFNFLPIRPMDGGQMLYALLCAHKSPSEADAVCKKIAVCGTVPLTAMGFCMLFRAGNYSLLLSSLYVVVVSLLLP